MNICGPVGRVGFLGIVWLEPLGVCDGWDDFLKGLEVLGMGRLGLGNF